MSSSGLEHLAQTAYEAHRRAHPASLPPWEEATEEDREAWKAAASAIAVQTGTTLAEALPSRSLVVRTGDERHTFHTGFDAGRQGDLVIGDDFASSRHARFYVAHGLWYIEDRRSTNGTWLNGRRIHGPQALKKGDRIRIGHTTITVVSTS